MGFIFKITLSIILTIEFTFAQTVASRVEGAQPLFYQNPKLKNYIAYLNTQPTIDDLAKTLSLAALDPSILRIMRKMMKEKKMSRAARTASVTLEGNKLSIEGLKYPIVFGNSTEMQLSYNGERIPIKNPKNFEETFREVESFFNVRVAGNTRRSGSRGLYSLMIFGETSHAIAIPIVAAIAIVGIMGLTVATDRLFGMVKNARVGVGEFWSKTWPFDLKKVGEAIRFQCDQGKFVVHQGKEKMIFERAGGIFNGNVVKAFKISNFNPDKRPKDSELVFDIERKENPITNGHFNDSAFFKKERLDYLYELAAKSNDLEKPFCNGSAFAGNYGPEFEALAIHLTKLAKQKDKSLPDNLLLEINKSSTK